jgi:hypothetical protein
MIRLPQMKPGALFFGEASPPYLVFIVRTLTIKGLTGMFYE